MSEGSARTALPPDPRRDRRIMPGASGPTDPAADGPPETRPRSEKQMRPGRQGRSSGEARRAAAALIVITAIAAMMGGCGAETTPLKTRIASLEKTNQALRDQIGDLEFKLQVRKDKDKGREKEGLVTCMRILLGLSREWKQRLNLQTLDFAAGGDMGTGLMAEEDVAEGRINYLTGGVTGIWGTRAKDLREKYDIWVKHLAGQNDGDAIFRLIKAYNAVSKGAIRDKYGQAFYDKVFVAGGVVPDPPAGSSNDGPGAER